MVWLKCLALACLVSSSGATDAGCDAKLDIVFAIDQSGSLGQNGFDQEMALTNAMVDGFNIAPDKVNFGFVGFSHHVRPEDKYALNGDTATVKSNLNKIYWTSGGTDLPIAVQVATEVINQSLRPDATKIIILITDGVGGNPTNYANAFKNADENNVLITIGVGYGVDGNLLGSIASIDENGSPLYFQENNFATIIAKVKDVTQKICESVATEPCNDLVDPNAECFKYEPDVHPVNINGKATVYCKAGYAQSTGLNWGETTCNAESIWTNKATTCIKTCPKITADGLKVHYSAWNELIPGTAAYVSCNDGFGSSVASVTLTCLSNGTWSGDDIKCERSSGSRITCENGENNQRCTYLKNGTQHDHCRVTDYVMTSCPDTCGLCSINGEQNPVCEDKLSYQECAALQKKGACNYRDKSVGGQDVYVHTRQQCRKTCGNCAWTLKDVQEAEAKAAAANTIVKLSDGLSSPHPV